MYPNTARLAQNVAWYCVLCSTSTNLEKYYNFEENPET
jgi:hypothetical protein